MLCAHDLITSQKSRTVARYEVVGFGWLVSAETVVGSWLDIEESHEIFLSRDLTFSFIYFIQPFFFLVSSSLPSISLTKAATFI